MEHWVMVVDTSEERIEMIRREWTRHQTQVQAAHDMVETGFSIGDDCGKGCGL